MIHIRIYIKTFKIKAATLPDSARIFILSLQDEIDEI